MKIKKANGNVGTRIVTLTILTGINIFTTFIENVVVAKYFGLSAALDAFLVGRALPDFLGSFIGTAVHASLIPHATEILVDQGKEQFYSFTQIFLAVGILIFAPVGILGFVIGPQIIYAVSGGFLEESRTASITMQAMFLLLPLAIFLVSGRGLLEIKGNFWSGSIPGITRSVLVVVLAVVAAHFWGPLILLYATLLSVIIGTILFTILLASKNRPENFFTDWFKWSDSILKILFGAIPVAFISSLYQLYPVIDRMMVSSLAKGSVSGLFYAFQIVLIPHTLINTSVSSVLFPTLSRLHVSRELDGIVHLATSSLRLLTLAGVIITAFTVIFRTSIISVVFQRGGFSFADTQYTSEILMFYALGFWTLGPISILTRLLLVLKKRQTLFVLGVIAAVFKVLLNRLLFPWGANGFAFSTTLTSVILMLLEISALRRLLPGLVNAKNFKDVAIFAFVCMVFVLSGELNVVFHSDVALIIARFINGFAFFAGIALIFHLPEYLRLQQSILVLCQRVVSDIKS